MMYLEEDEPPCMHHRSSFDTEPASPPSVLLPTATVLSFAGGDVSIPAPTRFDLVLSAQQWVTRAKEELYEFNRELQKEPTNIHEAQQKRYQRPVPPAIGTALDRLDAVLAELAKL